MKVMKKIKNLIALTALMVVCAVQVQGQEYYDEGCGEAYCDSGSASYMSAALPIGALAVAAIIIATTNRHHHHSSSSSSSCRNSSSSHCHSSSSSSSGFCSTGSGF